MPGVSTFDQVKTEMKSGFSVLVSKLAEQSRRPGESNRAAEQRIEELVRSHVGERDAAFRELLEKKGRDMSLADFKKAVEASIQADGILKAFGYSDQVPPKNGAGKPACHWVGGPPDEHALHPSPDASSASSTTSHQAQVRLRAPDGFFGVGNEKFTSVDEIRRYLEKAGLWQDAVAALGGEQAALDKANELLQKWKAIETYQDPAPALLSYMKNPSGYVAQGHRPIGPSDAAKNAKVKPDMNRNERADAIQAGWDDGYLLANMRIDKGGMVPPFKLMTDTVERVQSGESWDDNKATSTSYLSSATNPFSFWKDVGFVYDARVVQVHKAAMEDAQTGSLKGSEWDLLKMNSIYGTPDWQQFVRQAESTWGRDKYPTLPNWDNELKDKGNYSEVLVSLNQTSAQGNHSAKDVGRAGMLGVIYKLRDKAPPGRQEQSATIPEKDRQALQAMQAELHQHGADLPVFVYDAQTGSLTRLDTGW